MYLFESYLFTNQSHKLKVICYVIGDVSTLIIV